MSVTERIPGAIGVPSQRAVRSQIVGASCVALTALGWGLNWPATKLLVATCPPLSARGLSGLAACLILFAAAFIRQERLSVPRAQWPRLVVAALFNVTAWMGGTTAALVWLPAGQAATLAYTMPVWVCLLAWPVLRQRPSSRQMIAVAMAVCGIPLLLGGTGSSVTLTLDAAPGVVLALLAAVLFAFGTVYGKKHPLPLAPLALTAWQIGLGSIPLAVLGLTFEAPDFSGLPLFAWMTLGYTALVSMGLCYVTWFAARSRLSAPAAAIGTLLTPVIGVLASSIALGDPLGVNQLASLVLIALGIVLVVGP